MVWLFLVVVLKLFGFELVDYTQHSSLLKKVSTGYVESWLNKKKCYEIQNITKNPIADKLTITQNTSKVLIF